MTDETTPPGSYDPTPKDAEEGSRDLGAIVAAVGGTVSGIARDIADKAGPTVRSAAEKASPAVREATAKAAEVAAKAADAAGPIAHKVADVTSDFGGKIAERSREYAADVRRFSEGAADAVEDAAGDVAGRFRSSAPGADADRAVHDAAGKAADAGDTLGDAATRAADDVVGRPSAKPARPAEGACYHRPAMTPRDRYYLTTAIAYANNRPGLHTLYEVIGADAIARWHRMIGHDTRFLTGTDEHSVNIAQRAAEEGRSPQEFVDANVALFKAAEAALEIAPDRFIRTTDPDHIQAAQEMVRRAHANGDIYLGTYEGWYCPNEGFRSPSEVQETARGMICPNHPEVPLQWLSERNWFFRLSAYQDRLERHYADHPDFVQPEYRRNEMLGFIRQGLEDFSISRPGAGWGIPFPIAENGEIAQREDGTWDPEAGRIYVWYDALINYITGAGFPDDPAEFARWWPADLHVIGKDIARFHAIYWPAMLWSAGLEAPRRVWVHGFLLVQGERMSKSRGNFLDPDAAVTAFGADGARYVALREVPFDRDAEVSWDSFVRRYNADLANDFGNLVNRTVSMTGRYLAGARPSPGAAGDSALAEGWSATLTAYRDRLEGCLLHEALAVLWDFVATANKTVDAEQPWVLAKAATAGDDAAATKLQAVLGDLVEACRLVGLAVAPFMPTSAPQVLAQLGYGYPYGADGNGGPALLAELAWGAHAAEPGTLSSPVPLFPRLETEPD